MKAHALTARMIEDVEFPFLVLLVSGGHSLIAVAQSVDDFLLIGKEKHDIASVMWTRKVSQSNVVQCCNSIQIAIMEHAI